MKTDFDPVLRALGSEIRAEADYRAVALGDLAIAAGVSRTTLYLYLNNKRSIPLSVLLAIASHLDIGPDVLLDRAEQRASRDAQDTSNSQ